MIDYTYFDLFSIIVLSLSIIVAYFRGVTQEIFAILNWILSGFFAIFFTPILSPHLSKVPILDEIVFDNCELEILITISFTFILSLIFLSLLTPIFSRVIQKSNLKGLDNSLGVLFGLIRGIIIICIILIAHKNLLNESDYFDFIINSKSIDLLSDIMFSLNSLAPEDFKSWLTTQYANMTTICQM